MSDSYRCNKCGGNHFRVRTNYGPIRVKCETCDNVVEAPTVAEAFQAISQGEKKEKADGQA